MTLLAQVEVLRPHHDHKFKVRRLDNKEVVAHVKPEVLHRNIGNMPDILVRTIATKAGLMAWQGEPTSEVAYRYRTWLRAETRRRASENPAPSRHASSRTTRSSRRNSA